VDEQRLQLWAQEAEAELALFEWSGSERAQVDELLHWLASQDWQVLAQTWEEHREAVEQARSRCLQLAGAAWLALGPSLSPALNMLVWVLDNPESGRQAEAVAATECILRQAREQGWDRSDESAFAELSDKLDQCMVALLSGASLEGAVLDRLVQLLERTTYADVTGPTASR